MSKLRLIVDSYERVATNDAGQIVDIEHFGRGDLIEPRDDAERRRLCDISAAVDPQKQAKDEKATAESQIKQAEARLKALQDGGSDSLQSPERAEAEIAARREALESEATSPSKRARSSKSGG